MPPSLIELPAELRNIIWDYALKSDTGHLRYKPDTKRFDVSHIGAGLLTTCRSISTETLHTPVRLNTLVFDVDTMGDVDLWILLARLQRFEQIARYGLKLDLRVKGLQKPRPTTSRPVSRAQVTKNSTLKLLKQPGKLWVT